MLYKPRFVSGWRILLLYLPAVFIFTAASGASATLEHHRYFPKPHARTPAPAQPTDPVIVNAASFLPGVSPGGLATIFGEDLTSIEGIVNAAVSPLPTELAGITVLVNGIEAPLLSVSSVNGQDQISLQTPFETETGPAAATIEVIDHGETVATFQSDSYT